MNFLCGHAVLTEVLYDCSNFNFVHFLSLTHPSPVCSELILKSIALKFYSLYQRCWVKLSAGLRFHFNLFIQSAWSREQLEHTLYHSCFGCFFFWLHLSACKEKWGNMVFGFPWCVMRGSEFVVGTLWVQLFLQFWIDPFETLQVF